MALTLLRKQPNFALLWLAQLISFVGEGVFQLAMVWWLVQKTGSGTMVGLVFSISYLPAVLIGPFAGTLADRFYPKILLVCADLVRSLLIFVFAWMAWTDQLAIWHLFVLCGLLSTASAFHSPTTLAVIPRVVPEESIEEAMALHAIVRDLAKLVGPALGGMIMAASSAAVAFALDGIALLVSALMILMMRMDWTASTEIKESIWEQLVSGLSYVRSQGLLFEMLVGFSLLNLFAVPIMVLLPLTINRVMSLGSLQLGLAEGSLALGSVLAGLGFSRLFRNVRTSKLLVGTLGFSGLLFSVFAFNVNYPLFLAGLFFLGACFTSVNVAVLTLYQKIVDPSMKGRFFALVETLSFALFPIAMAGSGYLADALGIRETYVLCSAGIVLLTVRFSRIPQLLSIDSMK